MTNDRPRKPEPYLVELRRLMDTMAVLRGPDGCPWDREQTFRSLRPHVIEEAHELADAIETGDPEAVREECGDLLLQVVFLARIATEEGRFGMAEVARGIADKLIRRHPHVFGDGPRAEDSGEALASWEAVKAREAGRRTPLGGIPSSLPALLLATRALARTGEPGPIGEGVTALEAARATGDPQAWQQALGDLLFRVAGEARRAGTDPEAALRSRVRRELAAQGGGDR